ncbi:MAG: DNA cytosine methyltransferase [Luminiphilus sp.]|nr:DNA cytosine methyltransferase [Luminiphilus sp.]
MDNTKKSPTIVAFCAGYGGIERGLDLAGVEHRVLTYVEIEAFACANLVAKMETNQLAPTPIWTDLKTFPAHLFRDRVDIITGGYPCQPFSAAGKRAGKDDPRHLWPHIRRHIETIRPVRCFFENVDGHISLGLREVIEDLESLGYATTWGVFSAAEVGAPHQRKRVYILADANCDFIRQQSRGRGWENGQSASFPRVDGETRFVADTSSEGSQGSQWLGKARKEGISRGLTPECSDQLADTICSRSETGIPGSERPNQEGNAGITHNCDSEQGGWQIGMRWAPEPRLGRVVDGCANRVDRIRLLGNGVVPATAAKAWVVLNNQLLER